MNLVLHIERLVLEGVPLDFAPREQFRAALVAELSERLRGAEASPLLSGGGAIPALAAAARFDSVAPAHVAARLADSVAGQLAPPRARVQQ